MVVDIQTTPVFSADAPRMVFEGRYFARSPAQFDATADAQRFLMIKPDASEAQINIVLNWFEELRERVPIP